MKKLLFIAIVGFITACSTTKVITPPQVQNVDTTPCQFKTTLLDYTSNANCGYLFRLEDGTKLLPTKMPEVDMPFFDKKVVLMGYREYDAASTRTSSLCGIEDKAVEITCLEEYVDPNDDTPKSMEDCQPVKNVFKNSWMPGTVEEVKPKTIKEFDYSIGYLYLFETGSRSFLYDCLGNKMCDTSDGGDCESLIGTLGKGKVIQVLKN